MSVYWILLARFFVCLMHYFIDYMNHSLHELPAWSAAWSINLWIDYDWLAGWVSKRALQMLSTGNTTQQTKNYQNLLHVTCYDNGLENTVANLRRTSPEPFNSGLQRTDTVEWLNRGDWVAGQGFVVLWWTCLFCQVKVVVYRTLYIICLTYILYHTIPNQTRPCNCTTLHYITLHCMQ